mmetsp:Transcript_240/g.511  ORF Transcript_240/g.511 Transcript_240/m.511 type:complete len:117 (+) Transcript_240:111-461(+)
MARLLVVTGVLLAAAGAAAAPTQTYAKDHVMLQASIEQKKGVLTKKVPEPEPDMPSRSQEDTCSQFAATPQGSPGCKAEPQATKKAPAGVPTKGTSRLQKKTTMTKVVLNLEEDED